MSEQTTFEFVAGRLYWGLIRDAVSREKFHGREIRLWESGGWFRRMFELSGDRDAVETVASLLYELVERKEKKA